MFQVDAFADRVFAGNPAAVLICDAWPPDDLMQAIAEENNIAETAFAVPRDGAFDLRWFTPKHEAAFCGHATLATAHVLIAELGYEVGERLQFHTQVGTLRVWPRNGAYLMALPSHPPQFLDTIPDWAETMAGDRAVRAFENFENSFLELASEQDVRDFVPDLAALAGPLDLDLCITARGESVDFVSRYFAPRAGIPEDPVTGSTHATLVPFWAGRLGQTAFDAVQCSARGGRLECELQGGEVHITGSAVTFMRARITVP